MPRNSNKPLPKVVEKTILDDGKTRLLFDNGAVVIYPPLPGPEWQERVSRDICRLSYEILRRKDAEARAAL